MLVDANIMPSIMVPELLPFGQVASSSSGMITGNSNTGSGSFMFTGSGCPLITQAQIDKGFAQFDASVKAEIGDMMGGVSGDGYMSAETGFACFGVTLTCINTNISVNNKCETEVTPELLNVKVHPDLYPELLIQIEEDNGTIRPTPFVNVDDVGKKLKITVSLPACGDDVAPCWSYANIEYKLGPDIICSSDTITCAQNVAMNEPIVVDACGSTEFIRISTTRADVCKTHPDFLAVDTVVYAVRDQFGNVSDTCAQIRYIKKPNLDPMNKDGRIEFPGSKDLSCKEARFNEDGTLSLDVVGYPTLDGVSFKDINRESCNLFAEFKQYTDLRLECNNADRATRRITGQWFVYEWKCEGGITEIAGLPQVFTFIDNTPPIISELPGKLRFSVDDFECVASFTPPGATVFDECNNEFTTLEYRYLDNARSNEGQEVKLPPGVHNLEYIARDACGNEAIDTIEVTVVDESIPVAICLKETQVSIFNESIFIRATDIDQDSYDPCGIDSIKIRRAVSQCNPMDTLWQDQIEFCCEDVLDRTISVGLRVWSNGNWNECWVNVNIKGGAQAKVTCPPEQITVTCEYIYDESNPSSLEIFGKMQVGTTPDTILLPADIFVSSSHPLYNGTVSENCGVKIRELPPVVNIDSFCRTGTIDRTWEIEDNFRIQTCTQRIVIQGDQEANPALFTYVPPNDTITGMDGRTLESIAKNNPPRADNNGCSMIGISTPPIDRVFRTVGPSDYCAKVERTWYLIDWCRNGATPVDTHVQIIYINDTEAPVISKLGSESLVLPAAINVIVEDAVASSIQDLDISFTITGSGGSFSETLNNGNSTFGEDKATFVLPDVLPLGDYVLTWTVEDPCDNTGVQTQDITIVDAFRTTGEVIGQVLFSDGGVMDKVEVHLTKEEGVYINDDMDITDNDGGYAFTQASEGESYYIDPRKNDDILNGVTTLDILQIQRHVLGITPLTDAKRKIAADINNDGKISAFDLVELRKVLLGKTTSFLNNESWTFFYDGQNLDDIFLYGDEMMRRYFIPALEGKMDIDFEGIKIGDVSGDAIGHSAGISGGRSLSNVELAYSIEQIGNQTYVKVLASEDMKVSGLQAELAWTNGQQIDRLESGKLTISDDQFYVINDERNLRISNTERSEININKGDELFTLILNENANLDLSLVDAWLSAQVYTSEGTKGIQLKKVASETGVLTLMQNRPNPWSTSTTIAVEIPEAGEAVLRIYDMHSRVIVTESRNVEKGITTFDIDNTKIQESGMYFYEVEIAGQRAHHKMLRVD